MVGLFGSETFNRAKVLKKVNQHMNILRDQFRIHLERNPRYELPPMISTREWKALVDNGKERDLIKEGKLQPGT